MNVHVDWSAHYKAVSRRIALAALPKRLQLSAVRYESPIGPDRARPATLYDKPIGPVHRIQLVYVGFVIYEKSGDTNFFKRLRYNARLHRPKHHLDCVGYAYPIGPHNAPKSIRVLPEPKTTRDFIHVTTDPSARHMPAGRKIIDEVCKARRISENDLLSRRRTDEYVRVRHEICYRLKRETSLSLPQIGRMLNRDHTSVIHGIRKWEAMLAATAKATDEA